MKIFVMHHAKDLGGGTLSCFDIVNILEGENEDVSLVLPTGDHNVKRKAIEYGFNIIQEVPEIVTFNYYNGGSNLARVLLKFLSVKTYEKKWRLFFKKEKPDLVILNSIVQFPMIKILNELGIKNIQIIRETIKKDKNSIVNKYISQKLYKSSKVLFISNYDKQTWNLSTKVKQYVIPDVVEINKSNSVESLNDFKFEPGIFYLLFVGGMSEIKGPDILIKAMNELKHLPIKLLFLGNNESLKGLRKFLYYKQYKYAETIKRYIKDNNLTNTIIFAGTQNEMNSWYDNSDLVVFPAKIAHQARPIFEAGNAKKAIILPNFDNFKEYVKEEYNGMYFESNNYSDLTEKIIYLFNNTELLLHLGMNNYKETVNNHTYDSIREDWKKILHEVVVE